MKQLRLFGYLLAIIGMMSFHYAFAQKVETKYVRITPGEGKQLHLYFLTQDMPKLTIEGERKQADRKVVHIQLYLWKP